MATALGVDVMSVYRWEKGMVVPRLDHAASYRTLLDQLDSATETE
jgi:hypothetical protein